MWLFEEISMPNFANLNPNLLQGRAKTWKWLNYSTWQRSNERWVFEKAWLSLESEEFVNNWPEFGF